MYKIIRFKFKGENKVIKENLTLEEAQEHCSKEETHGGAGLMDILNNKYIIML